MSRKANRDCLSADVQRSPLARVGGNTSALRRSLWPVRKADRHMELDTAVSQGADAGAIPVGSYNYTESGMLQLTSLSSKSGNVPGQFPLSPVVTA